MAEGIEKKGLYLEEVYKRELIPNGPILKGASREAEFNLGSSQGDSVNGHVLNRDREGT